MNLNYDEYGFGSTDYVTGLTFMFPGTYRMGNPKNIKVMMYISSSTLGDLRIWDETNGNTIAELTDVSAMTKTIKDLGELDNLPIDEAIWELQMRLPLKVGKETLSFYNVAVLF